MKKIFTFIVAVLFCAQFTLAQKEDHVKDTVPGGCRVSFVYISYDLSMSVIPHAGVVFEFTGISQTDSVFLYWNFGDGTTAEGRTVQHTFPRELDTVEVCLTAITVDGCESKACKKIAVNSPAPPIKNCEISFDIEVMESFPPQYRFVPSIKDSLGRYQWDFGDGMFSSDISPVHVYETSDRYVIGLYYTSADSCTDYATDTLNADGYLQCHAMWESYREPYYDSSVTDYHTEYLRYIFRDLSNGNVDQWHWDFGDGTYSDESNPQHVYSKPGIYTVCLNIKTTDGCVSYYCNEIFVESTMECQYMGTVRDYTGLDGCGLLIELDNGTILEPAEFAQNFVIHAGQRVILSYTELTDRAGICMRGIIARINCISEIPDTCSANFTHYALPWVSSVPRIYQFYPMVDSTYTTIWDLGDGTVTDEYNPMHRFPFDNYYTVCLTVSNNNGCTSTNCETSFFDGYDQLPVLCNAYIRLTTDIILDGQTCNGSATASLVDEYGNNMYATGYLWSTGETTQSISGLCPGSTYSIVIQDTSGCAVSGSFSLGNSIIYPDSVIGYWNYEQDYLDFVFNVPILKEDVYCEWDFGDGEIAQGSSVTHSYDSVTEYMVTFRIFDNLGNELYNQQIPVSAGNATGFKEEETVDLKIYPVPARDQLHIMLPENRGAKKIEVIGSGGQTVLVYTHMGERDKEIELNVSDLPAGFYIGKLLFSNGRYQVFKFVK